MPDSFGARLRERREQQHIALTTIAEQTKIQRSLLEALERDDLGHWPSGIFRRAWIRSYASAIGLDADATVREFLDAHPDPVEVVAEPAPIAPPAAAPRLRGIVDAALGSLSRRRRRSETPEPIVSQSYLIRSDAAQPDLQAIAAFCTALGQVDAAKDIPPLLQTAAALLEATGLIVWVWDHRAEALRPALFHGYSAELIAHLPRVTLDADNATAAAFRSGQTQAIPATADTSGALVIPLLIPSQCAGVLAIELRPGTELTESRRAVAVILAAALAQLIARAKATQIRAALGSARAAKNRSNN